MKPHASPQKEEFNDSPNFSPYCHDEWALRKWSHLRMIAPKLWRFRSKYVRPGKPPAPITDGLFLALCATFANPTKREILRALILDLLADDLAELLANVESDGSR